MNLATPLRTRILLPALLAIACHESPGGGPPGGPPPPPPAVTCPPPLALADVSRPTTVVGTGTPASCTEAGFAAAVAQGGVIAFNCGTDPFVLPLTSEKRVRLDVDTTIDGGGSVTLSGGGATRLLALKHPNFESKSPTLRLQRLGLHAGYVTGPSPAGGGAAVYHYGGTVEAVDCVFSSNAAAASGPDVAGGAIFGVGNGDTVVVGSVFKDNSASSGGAVGSLYNGLVLVNDTFSRNSATGANGSDGGNGGAVSMDGENKALVICGSTFTGNTANYLGSAVFRTAYHQESTTIDRSLFQGGVAERATLFFMGTALAIANSTIAGNTGRKGWGGLFVSKHTLDGMDVPGSAAITNTTLAGNSAGTSLGGALWVDDDQTTVTLTHATVAGNLALFGAIAGRVSRVTFQDSLVAGNVATAAWNPISCTSGSAGSALMQWPRENGNGQAEPPCAGAGTTFGDPRLQALSENGGPTPTMALPPGSPAASAGVHCDGADQRGVARPASGCALGAYQP